jgi:hypothetical protein
MAVQQVCSSVLQWCHDHGKEEMRQAGNASLTLLKEARLTGSRAGRAHRRR